VRFGKYEMTKSSTEKSLVIAIGLVILKINVTFSPLDLRQICDQPSVFG